MDFNLEHCIINLRRTPVVIQALLHDLPEGWVKNREGEGSWNTKEIIAHLILGERTDWISRAKIILADGNNKAFAPFDMDSHIELAKNTKTRQLRNEFSKLRSINLAILTNWQLDENQLNKTGIHPEFGEVTLKQLLATWVAHDLSHIAQISRVLAAQYKNETGPWKKYLKILQ
jgi:hypothetical protein